MEKSIVGAVKSALPNIDVYHDFAPEESRLPLVVIQRVGGEGNLYLDRSTDGGYQVRFSLSVWDYSRLSVVEKSRLIEDRICDDLVAVPLSAADSVVIADTGAYGMVQDFLITA